MPNTENTWLVKVKEAIEGMSPPAPAVRQGAEPMANLPDNTVQVTPIGLTREPAGGGKQRWHLSAYVALRVQIIAPTASASAWRTVFDKTRELLIAIEDSADLQAGGSGLVEKTRRTDVDYWVVPPGDNGSPAGCLLTVTADWVQ